MTITWEQVLAFLCEDQTMAITSLLFLAFFAAVALINYALPRVLRPYFLLAASYGFFCYDPVNRPLVWVIAAATVLTWLCGLIIGKVRAKPVRVLALAASVGFGIGILVYYKYWNLLADTVGGSILSHRENLLAPLGLSYFTFAAMSYTIDVYKRRCRVETNLMHYALFVSFFPTLINGPIERYPQMRPQIRKSRRFSYGRCAGGAFRMLWGYTKKMVLADNLSHYVSLVYGDVGSMSGPNLVAATVLFAVQLYMDFSGSMDAVTGTAQILGVTMPENFRQPFFSKTISEFWKRWHITLGTWFKDYVFYPVVTLKPLEKLTSAARKRLGNHYGPLLASAVALFCVWFCNGLWHGAAWSYLFFGMYHFVLILGGNIIAPPVRAVNARLHIRAESFPYRLLQMLRTTVLVIIGELFFRANGLRAGMQMFRTMVTGFAFPVFDDALFKALGIDKFDLMIVAVTLLIVFVVSVINEKGKSVRTLLAQRPAAVRWAVFYALILFIIVFGAYGKGYIPVDPMYANF